MVRGWDEAARRYDVVVEAEAEAEAGPYAGEVLALRLPNLAVV